MEEEGGEEDEEEEGYSKIQDASPILQRTLPSQTPPPQRPPTIPFHCGKRLLERRAPQGACECWLSVALPKFARNASAQQARSVRGDPRGNWARGAPLWFIAAEAAEATAYVALVALRPCTEISVEDSPAH